MLNLARIRVRRAVVWVHGIKHVGRRSSLPDFGVVLGHCSGCVGHSLVRALRCLVVAVLRYIRMGALIAILETEGCRAEGAVEARKRC